MSVLYQDALHWLDVFPITAVGRNSGQGGAGGSGGPKNTILFLKHSEPSPAPKNCGFYLNKKLLHCILNPNL